MLGCGFFSMIFMATYMANLASILVTDRTVGSLKDIDDVMKRGVPLCVMESQVVMVSDLYPGASKLIVPKLSRKVC